MKIKHFLILALIAMLCISFVSCDEGKTDNTLSPESQSETESAKEPVSSQTASSEVKPTDSKSAADVWNGQAATAFAGGTGTNSDPYMIRTSAQLSFLAKQVNAGTSYSGKYFSLESDLDLNRQKWTPIGSYNKPFCGFFNGNHHTISNLNVSAGITTGDYSVAGLFGAVKDGTLKNLALQKATVSLESSSASSKNYIGGLIGYMATNTKDIQIENCFADTVSLTVGPRTDVYIGGLFGYIYAKDNTEIELSKVQSVNCKIELSSISRCFEGGIAGILFCNNSGRIQVKDFCSYLTAKPVSAGNQYLGAFGFIEVETGRVTLNGGFSRVQYNGNGGVSASNSSSGSASYRIYSLIGGVYTKTNNHLFLYNLFGDLRATDNPSSLYDCDFATVSVVESVKSLPQNHTLSSDKWDLSSLSSPKLLQTKP